MLGSRPGLRSEQVTQGPGPELGPRSGTWKPGPNLNWEARPGNLSPDLPDLGPGIVGNSGSEVGLRSELKVSVQTWNLRNSRSEL